MDVGMITFAVRFLKNLLPYTICNIFKAIKLKRLKCAQYEARIENTRSALYILACKSVGKGSLG